MHHYVLSVNKLLLILCAGGVLATGCVSYRPARLAADETLGTLEERSLSDPALRAFVSTNLQREFPEWPPKEWDLPALTLVAFYFHPSLDVARAQWGVASAGKKTAGGRPNPTVSLQPGYNLDAAAGVTPWIPGLTFDWPIETAGKRGKRISHAQHLATAARLNLLTMAWQVRGNLRTALLDHAAAARRAALLQDQFTAEQQLVTLLEQRLAAGAIARPEVTPARLALIKTTTDLAEAKRLRAESQARVAEALGLPAKAIAGAEFHFDLGSAATTDTELPAQTRRQALLGRADLLAALAEYAATESTLQLEIARQYPDVHFNPGYQWDQGESKWTLGIGFELPVLNHNRGPIAEALAKRTEAAAKFVALQAKVIAEIDRALANRAAVQEQLGRSQALLDTHRQQVEAMQAAFNAGGADRLELQAALVEAAASELARLDAQFKAQQALGQLEDALQQPFAALAVIERGRAGPSARKEQP